MLEGAHHQHARIVAENVLGAVAMVHVEIDDGDACEPMVLQRVSRRDGNVVEQAEAHRAIARRMVPRRPDAAKSAIRLPVQHQVGGKHRSAGRVQCSVPGMRIHRGVRIQMDGAPGRRAAAHMTDIFHGMHPRQAAHSCRRGLMVGEVLADAGRDQLIVYRTQPFRALRMISAHVVLATMRVGDKSGGHMASCARWIC